MSSSTTGVAVVVLIFASVALGAGFQFIVSGSGGSATTSTVTSTTSGNSSAPYILTLIITTNNAFNSSIGDQPAYFVVGAHGLESAANITVPAHRTVELVIMNFDQDNATLAAPQDANVTGTVGGMISVYGNQLVNSSQGPNGLQIKGTQTVSSLPPSLISHTFTVPSLGLNIPMESESTVVAYFTTGGVGSYTWLCQTACGSGDDGQGGAMVTGGWMTGALTVV